MTRGLRPTFVFAPNFFLRILPSASEFMAEESAGVLSRGVGALDTPKSVSSSLSRPKDNLPLPATLRFFLKSGFGVDILCFAN
jgi:hypothetical protein